MILTGFLLFIIVLQALAIYRLIQVVVTYRNAIDTIDFFIGLNAWEGPYQK